MRSLADDVRRGDRLALARALRLIDEGGTPGEDLLVELRAARQAPRSWVVGVSGPGGCGKSTLIASLASPWRQRGLRVAIIAADPASPRTGGAILGDRVRMSGLEGDDGVFVRSFACAGGDSISSAVLDAVELFDAAGFERILIETVGAGQGQTTICEVADTALVLVEGGDSGGDQVQALKAGLIEVAHVIVITKGDLPGGARRIAELGAFQSSRRPVLACSAFTGEGVPEVVNAVEEHRLSGSSQGQRRSIVRLRQEILRLVSSRLDDQSLRALASSAQSGRGRVSDAARAAARLLLNDI